MSKRADRRAIEKVQTYLRNNPGSNLPAAYEATGYNGPPLKIKSGNLTTNRGSIRVSVRGDAGDANRRQSMSLRPPQSKEEANQNRRQRYKARNLKAQGHNVVIDHKVELDLLRSTVEGQTPQQATRTIETLEQSYGPLGNRPQNRQIIGAKANELKRQQTRQVQRRLGQMEARNGSLRLGFGDMTGGYTGAESLPRRIDMDPFGTGATIMIP